LAEARDLLTLLPGYKIQKINHANNRVARELARFGPSAWSGGVLMSTTLTCVLDSAQRDCNDSCKRTMQIIVARELARFGPSAWSGGCFNEHDSYLCVGLGSKRL
jgi:hypothetical protein